MCTVQLMDNGAYGRDGPRAQQLVVLAQKQEPENVTTQLRLMGDMTAQATEHNTGHALTVHVQVGTIRVSIAIMTLKKCVVLHNS